MNKLLVLFISICLANTAFGWNYSLKANAQNSFTDNVNLSNTDRENDSYATYSAYLQAKNNIFKIKLSGRTEKYNSHGENDNYSFDLNLQYKRTKNNDLTFSIFKQVYNGVPLVSTDTTSDNSGGRLSTTFSTDFNKETTGYLILNGTYKKYPNLSNRNDKILGVSFGLEYYFNSNWLLNPEFLVANNSSSDSYYKNTFYEPSLTISFTPNELWELYINSSYSHTKYAGRTVASIVKNKIVNSTEYQDLLSIDFGTIYTLLDKFPFQLKYSNNKNSSNNSNSAYKAGILSFSIGMKL